MPTLIPETTPMYHPWRVWERASCNASSASCLPEVPEDPFTNGMNEMDRKP